MWDMMSGATAATGAHEGKKREGMPTWNPANQSWNSPTSRLLDLRFNEMSVLFLAWRTASLEQEENRNEP